MQIRDLLVADILAQAQITAAIGTRLYPKPLQGKPFPFMVLSRISHPRIGNLRTKASLAKPRFQVDIWAATLQDAQGLGAIFRQRYERFFGTFIDDTTSPATAIKVWTEYDDESDQPEEDVVIAPYRNSADYFVWYQTQGGTY